MQKAIRSKTCNCLEVRCMQRYSWPTLWTLASSCLRGVLYTKKNQNGFWKKVVFGRHQICLFSILYKKKVIFLTKTIFFSFAFDQKIIFHVKGEKNGFLVKMVFWSKKTTKWLFPAYYTNKKITFWDKTTFFSILYKKKVIFGTKSFFFPFCIIWIFPVSSGKTNFLSKLFFFLFFV